MPFFQADAVRSHRDGPISLKSARADLAAGTAIQVIVAGAVLLMAASVRVGPAMPMSHWLARLGQADGGWASDMFAIGLFDAGFVAALTVSFSSAWTVVHTWSGRPTRGEPVQGRTLHHLGQRLRGASATYLIFATGLVVAALAVVIPGAPLALYAVGAQALSALLMPPIIFVLFLLTRRADILGRFRSRLVGSGLALIALIVFGSASIWLLLQG
jgi:Mn2+/Fe2+ NRAMP family transporter